jgi:hypothetical protein
MFTLSYEYQLQPTPEPVQEIERTLVIGCRVGNCALTQEEGAFPGVGLLRLITDFEDSLRF